MRDEASVPIITGRTCSNCKHRGPEVENSGGLIECHYYPPHTMPLLVGKTPKGGPMIHNHVYRDVTEESADCAFFTPKVLS